MKRFAAAREEAEERRLQRVGPREERGDVAVEVVDGDQREPARPGERLRRGDADQERTDESRALRDADRLDVAQIGVRLVERPAHGRQDQLQMMAGGHLRDDAAVGGVQLGLGGDDVCEDPPIP